MPRALARCLSCVLAAMLLTLSALPTEGAYAPIRITQSGASDLHPVISPDGLTIYFESNRGGNFHLFKVPTAGGAEVQLTFGPGDERYPSLSPDGTELAFSRLDPDQVGALWKVSVAGGATQQLTTGDHAGYADWHPVWSRDGATIYFLRRGATTGDWDLSSVPATGGSGTTFLALPGTQTITRVSRDGLRLIFGSDHVNGVINVFECPLANPAMITQLTAENANTVPMDVSNDDSHFLVASRAVLGQFEMFEVERATLSRTRLTFDAGPFDPNTLYGGYIPGSPDYFFSSRRVTAEDNVWRLSGAAQPAHITLACPPPQGGPLQPGQSYSFTFRVCNDGGLPALVPWCASDLFGWNSVQCGQVDAQPNGCTSVVVAGIVPLTTPLCEPNVFTFKATPGDSSLTCAVNVALQRGGTPSPTGHFDQLTSLPQLEDRPCWTPDGQYLVYESAEAGNIHIYRKPVAGGPAVALTSGGSTDRFPQVSPDGQRVVYSRLNGTTLGGLAVVSINGGVPLPITNSGQANDADWHPIWSADGGRVYFVHRDGSSLDWDLATVPATGGAVQTLLHLPGTQSQMRLAADGEHLVFASDHANRPVLNIYECPLSDPSALTRLTYEPGNTIPGGVSADGSWVLVSSRRTGPLELFELDRATLVMRQLTFDGTGGPDPNTLCGCYEPGGPRIAFSSRRVTGEDNLWLLTPTESGSVVCPECPPAQHAAVGVGTTVTIPFGFCNCGSIPGRYAWCLTDDRGWNPAQCDTVALAAGQSFTVTASLQARSATPDTNHVRLRVTVVGNPFETADCAVALPVTEPPIAVILTRFAALAEPTGLRLLWESGEAAGARLDLFRREGAASTWQRLNSIAFAPGPGDYLDLAVVDGRAYDYRLEATDRAGARVVVGELQARYVAPAPQFGLVALTSARFNARLVVGLSLESAGAARVRVFDVSGRLVRTLLDEAALPAGVHRLEWDGRDEAGRAGGDGIYFIRAHAAAGTRTLRVVRLR